MSSYDEFIVALEEAQDVAEETLYDSPEEDLDLPNEYSSESAKTLDVLNKRRIAQSIDESETTLKQHNLLFQAISNATHAAIMDFDEDSSADEAAKVDHRLLPRGERRVYDHNHCWVGLQRDYIGPKPLFDGKEFDTMFRISRSRFQRLLEDIGNADVLFYTHITDRMGKVGASMEARLLLPLKTIAYGVASHVFRDTFQMSRTLARKCCVIFDQTIANLYTKEYLRMPTKEDLIAISKLHQAVHGFDGIFGSLDCMHTYWKNCPTAWQGSYKGKEKKPSIVLEAICDYHLWFWHGAYGYTGTMNDKTIWSMSPFYGQLLDGSFENLERAAGIVPFKIGEQEFNHMYILVDGIYPRIIRFVHGIKSPIKERDRVYTKWQEAVRKDIERAFGVLQGKWQCLARPMHQISLEQIGMRMTCCLILHNMCVSDRVMEGDVRARYNPASSLVRYRRNPKIKYPADLLEKQGVTHDSDRSQVGASLLNKDVTEELIRTDRWRNLKDLDEFMRLHVAIANALLSKKRRRESLES
jgi:Plant transposon protein